MCRSSNLRARPRPRWGAASGDREDFGLIAAAFARDDAVRRIGAAAQDAIRNHIALDQQALDFLLPPAPPECGRVQRGDGGSRVTGGRFGRATPRTAQAPASQLSHGQGEITKNGKSSARQESPSAADAHPRRRR